ncbi:MAG: transcriptional repressor LexA [Defluviitaleaceae bacterium]|nr:transcriptional repressor LexA [Defluviitaleaceae bacterium]
MEPLTEKQDAIFCYLKSEIRKKGYPPTVREICDAVGLCSTSTVHSHLETLEKKGYIRRSPTKNRSIEILEDNFYAYAREQKSVPIVSKIARDAPILALENIEGVFPVPPGYIPAGSGGELFMLRIKPGAEAGDGLREGDLVLIDRESRAGAGDLAAVAAQNAAGVKIARVEKDVKKAGRSAPDRKDANNCEILGKVIGMYRKYY